MNNNPNKQLVLPATLVGDDGIELASNNHPRGPVVACVDISASCAPHMPEIQSAIDAMLRTILVEDEMASLRADLCIVTFGGGVNTPLPFGAATPGEIPQLEKLVANGDTPLGGAVRHTIAMVTDRVASYRRLSLAKSYNPQILICSDGRPTDDWQSAADQLRQLAESEGWIVHAFGAGPDADLQALSRFSTKPATRIDPSQFRELFQWFSRSIRLQSRSHRPGTSLPQILPAIPPL